MVAMVSAKMRSRLGGFLVGVCALAATVSGRILHESSSRRELAAGDPPRAIESSGGSKPRYWIYLLGFGSALVLVILISVSAIAYFRHKRRSTAVSPWKQGMSGQLQRVFDTTAPLLKREEVEAACEDFSNIIGSSTDNVVYKGTLSNGTEIAATMMRVSSESWTAQKELSFRRKVEALARMKHQHLVNLVGYCSEETPVFTRILVFEYASNGTLYDHLHNKESEHLDWATRMRVIMGAAYGLSYMHHELVPPTSHLNLDAHAIFLTDDYAAKVANFAVSKMAMARSDGDRRKSSSWLGSANVHIGYEDADADRHSPDFESNMYSFGILMLEVISGRVPHSDLHGSLVDWASEYLNDPKMVWYIVDPSLKSHKHDDLVALCKIVSSCLAARNRRPSMRRVVTMLTEVLKLTPESVGPKSSANMLWAQLELQDDDTNSEQG